MDWDIYIAASLSQSGSTERNSVVLQKIEELGLRAYLPKIDNLATDSEIFERNLDQVTNSQYILFVPEEGGDGVFMEVGFAIAHGKKIIGFIQNNLQSYGRMTRGFWETLPDDFRATTHNELKEKLHKIFKINA